MRNPAAVSVLGAALAASTAVHAGHEPPLYPSYYPQEIRVEQADPAAAARLLPAGKIHAYVGRAPAFAGPAPPSVRFVESLGSFLVVRLNPDAPAAKDAASACATVTTIVKTLAENPGRFVVHPYPVNGFHADHLHHADRAEAEKARILAAPAEQNARLKVRAEGELAAMIPAATPASADWDVSVDEIDRDRLLAGHAFVVNGTVGPPWLKSGWFHAYLLLAPSLADAAQRERAAMLAARLKTGRFASPAERINAERDLVRLLTAGCQSAVAGYAPKREYYSAEYSEGVENIAYDSHTGFNSAIFIRTVKLKDFPWNGWLRLGVPSPPAAAWNPFGGFSDDAGRLVWSALGDPAMFPNPYGADWIFNRFGALSPATATAAHKVAVALPGDALLPEPGSGRLALVGPGKTAVTKLTYAAMISPFHDETAMTAADLLYPYAFAYRWSAHDPAIGTATALLRQSLRGFKYIGRNPSSQTIRFGDLTYVREQLLVDVYIDGRATDFHFASALAPPWSALPWHAIALMEEAVTRGWAAFSKDEAARLGVEWLDPVRSDPLKRRLKSVVEEFKQAGYVPAPLAGLVTEVEARARWAALAVFHAKHGHFLVTNGPYGVKSWEGGAAVLEVVRDPNYPLGVGSYDSHAIPRHAWVVTAKSAADGLVLAVEVETIDKMMRDYKIVRRPLKDAVAAFGRRTIPDCRFIVVDERGNVALFGQGRYRDDGTVVLNLKGKLGPGRYNVFAAVFPNGNTVNAEIRRIPYATP